VYGNRITVQVVDQFGGNLDSIYERQQVYEVVDGNAFPIHQFLTDSGTYKDPVGYMYPLPPHTGTGRVRKPVVNFNGTQNFGVRIAGHHLQPVSRGVTVVRNTITITWNPGP
jgi:hypothetical protein